MRIPNKIVISIILLILFGCAIMAYIDIGLHVIRFNINS